VGLSQSGKHVLAPQGPLTATATCMRCDLCGSLHVLSSARIRNLYFLFSHHRSPRIAELLSELRAEFDYFYLLISRLFRYATGTHATDISVAGGHQPLLLRCQQLPMAAYIRRTFTRAPVDIANNRSRVNISATGRYRRFHTSPSVISVFMGFPQTLSSHDA
jgi:hypothetical protein